VAVSSLVWRGEFRRDYAEVRGWLDGISAGHYAGRYLMDILDDAIAVGLSSVVGLDTSMHDLMFAPLPANPPVDVVIVRAPGSLRPPGDGLVRIEFLAASGRSTTIERPSSEGVALFWRFMSEEFGVTRGDPPTVAG
jgi:hypothetical protein